MICTFSFLFLSSGNGDWVLLLILLFAIRDAKEKAEIYSISC